MKQQWSPRLTFLLLVCVLFFSSPVLTAQATVPVDVRAAAGEGLDRFADLEKDRDLVLGDGFRVFTVFPRSLLDGSGQTLSKKISPTGLWRFIVLENGKPAGLLTVANVDGQWQAVSLGGSGLAAEIQAVKNAWPGKQGFECRFVRIYQARSDFMEIRKAGDSLGYAPLAAAKQALMLQSFQLGPSALLHDSEILEPLKKLVKETISTGHELEKGKR